jgi:hypothetical protein
MQSTGRSRCFWERGPPGRAWVATPLPSGRFPSTVDGRAGRSRCFWKRGPPGRAWVATPLHSGRGPTGRATSAAPTRNKYAHTRGFAHANEICWQVSLLLGAGPAWPGLGSHPTPLLAIPIDGGWPCWQVSLLLGAGPTWPGLGSHPTPLGPGPDWPG